MSLGLCPTKLPMTWDIWPDQPDVPVPIWHEAKPRTSQEKLHVFTRSSLTFREVSVFRAFREVMTMPTIFFFHDGPYIISMTSSIRHDVDQIILMRPFSCRMTTPPIPTRPR